MHQIRQQCLQEHKNIKNTYLEDFAFLETLEPEGGVINDAINIAASSIEKPKKQHVAASMDKDNK